MSSLREAFLRFDVSLINQLLEVKTGLSHQIVELTLLV